MAGCQATCRRCRSVPGPGYAGVGMRGIGKGARLATFDGKPGRAGIPRELLRHRARQSLDEHEASLGGHRANARSRIGIIDGGIELVLRGAAAAAGLPPGAPLPPPGPGAAPGAYSISKEIRTACSRSRSSEFAPITQSTSRSDTPTLVRKLIGRPRR